MTTGTEIINNGASLKITAKGDARLILKRHIREISVIKPSVVKLDLGSDPLRNIFLEHSEVTNPQTQSSEELRDALNEMLKDCINEIHQELNQITISVEAINSKIFIEALIVDEATSGAGYRGYAIPGSKTFDAVWAIQKISEDMGTLAYQWAEGNRNFDKVWDNRKSLNYK